jgi:hypothetical protein
MAKRKKERAPKKSSSTRCFRLSDYPRFIVLGDVLVRDYRIPVEVALPKDSRRGLFAVTSLSQFGEDVLQREISRHDLIALNIAGRNINARVATMGNSSIWIFGEPVLRGLAHSASFDWKRLFGKRGKPDVKRKKAQRNG